MSNGWVWEDKREQVEKVKPDLGGQASLSPLTVNGNVFSNNIKTGIWPHMEGIGRYIGEEYGYM